MTIAHFLVSVVGREEVLRRVLRFRSAKAFEGLGSGWCNSFPVHVAEQIRHNVATADFGLVHVGDSGHEFPVRHCGRMVLAY